MVTVKVIRDSRDMRTGALMQAGTVADIPEALLPLFPAGHLELLETPAGTSRGAGAGVDTTLDEGLAPAGLCACPFCGQGFIAQQGLDVHLNNFARYPSHQGDPAETHNPVARTTERSTFA